MKQFATKQRAYVGRFAIRDTKTGVLIGVVGVTAPRPRLYETVEAATEAAAAYTQYRDSHEASHCEPVELV